MTKVVLITGASSGIGQSMAQYLQQKGLEVYGTSRRVRHGEIRDGVHFVQMDVTDESSVQEGVDYVLKQAGRIDVLVNNAGIGMVGAVEDSSPEEMKKHFETNYYGPLRTMRSVLPSMRKNRKGLIVNISSLAALFALPYRGGYCAAKSALSSLTEAMRMELLSYNVHAVSLCPGDYKTAISNSRIEAEASKDSAYAEEFDKVHDILNEELHESGNPIEVAQILWKIINTKKPKPYYLAARPFQKFVVHLRYWLPTKTFQWLMMRNYKMLDSKA